MRASVEFLEIQQNYDFKPLLEEYKDWLIDGTNVDLEDMDYVGDMPTI